MAAIRSLGLHEPSALSYLTTESILPVDPPRSSYQWRHSDTTEGGTVVTDEVLRTSSHVVWSRNGTVKRVFNLDIEGELILDAFNTSFTSTSEIGSEVHAKNRDISQTQRALVVVLKTQAHIFLLSGDSHILPITFDVENAQPCAHGFILQRKLSGISSIAASLADPDAAQVSGFIHSDPRMSSTPSLRVPEVSQKISGLAKKPVKLPRTYYFTEIISELGLVVSGSARKPEPLDNCQVLPLEEEIVYVSHEDELSILQNTSIDPVYIAVTINSVASTLTIWQVLFEQASTSSKGTAGTEKNINLARRKSSNVYGRQIGAATPTSRGPGMFRESFVGLTQSLAENVPFQLDHEPGSKQNEDIASQLGYEFEQAGIQTRSARRVSSMLARTDLGAVNDRSTFNDITLGTASRKSLSRSIRRGESLGGFSDRQSFGRRRSSFQASGSVMSDGTSFLDIPVNHVAKDGAPSVVPYDLIEEHAVEQNIKLPRQVGFMKLRSLPRSFQNTNAVSQPSFEIMTMLAPDTSTADDRRNRRLSVCIMDRAVRKLTIVDIAIKMLMPSSRSKNAASSYELKAVEVHHGQGVIDACKLTDGFTQRLLTLTQTRNGESLLHLEAPWSAPYRISLPPQYRIFDPTNTAQAGSPDLRRETGIHRILAASDFQAKALRSGESGNRIIIVDQEQRCHCLQVRLLPSSSSIQRILDTINFVLPPEHHDSLLVAWWEVKRWVQPQLTEMDIDWTSLVVTLFLLAVPFISKIPHHKVPNQRRRKSGVLRSSNSSAADTEHLDHVIDHETAQGQIGWLEHPAWAWMTSHENSTTGHTSSPKHARFIPAETGLHYTKDAFACRCANLARDFLQSPAGESATGPEGYLPTSVNMDRSVRRMALASIVIGLHLLQEDIKLDNMILSQFVDASIDLTLVIAQLATWLRWEGWKLQFRSHYYGGISNNQQQIIEDTYIDSLETPKQPFNPPSIFEYVENIIAGRASRPFPSLLDLVSLSRSIPTSHSLWKEAARLTPRSFAITAFLGDYSRNCKPRNVIDCLEKYDINEKMLSSFPDGINALCNQAIVAVRCEPRTSYSTAICKLLGQGTVDGDDMLGRIKLGHIPFDDSHESDRDHRTITNTAIETDNISRWDASSEADRQTITRLIFSEDRRFQEASKLVNQTRPPIVECVQEPGWNESDLLEAQKDLAQYVTKRTLSVPAGRGMMHFNARVPLLTERVPIPAFSLQCVMKQQSGDNTQPMTFSADKALFTEDKTCWAFFHNGASAGLMISKDAKWIDTSWILYNKPPELTNRHAGFLLALGLNGHLKSLAKWVAFKYLTPKHTMISVGLLLGLACSYIGTMDTLVTRLLSVHVTRLLPPGAAELNLSPLTQTTGLVGIGFLYHSSQHRRMSEIMLSEIENNNYEERSGDEPILRDEGYRLAAGFSLGLINLGHGKKLHALHDIGVIERLLKIAIGTKNVNHVHVLDRATAGAVIGVAFIFLKTNNEDIASKIDIPDTLHQFDYVRPDVFLLRTLARHLIMWDSITPSSDFIRKSLPKAYQKRADLSNTKRLSTDDLPFFNIVAGICFAMSLRFAGSHASSVRDLLILYLDQFLRLSRLPALNYDSKVTLNSIRYCLDVLALSCATVMAGSGDLVVLRRLRSLHGRVDKETPFGSHLAAHMAIGALFLSGGTSTFGTSNLAIASLVIAFYPVFPTDVLDNRGHLQALRHLWVLAVEDRCLISRDGETGQIISGITAQLQLVDGTHVSVRTPGLLPDLNSIHLIKFNHEGYWDVDIDLSAQDPNSRTTVRERYQTAGKGINIFLQRRAAYEKADIQVFMTELQALNEARGIPSADPNAPVNERWKHSHSHTATGQSQAQDPFDWIFRLDAFKNFDHAEKALVLDTHNTLLGSESKLLKSTVVDSRLEFEMGILGLDHDGLDPEPDQNESRTAATAAAAADSTDRDRENISLPGRSMDRDKLWQLRLLLACADRWEKEQEEEEQEKRNILQQPAATGSEDEQGKPVSKEKVPMWMKKDVIKRLRWRIWKMASSGSDGDGENV